MIAVIADDLTGAAEIGGVGLQYGLSVEVVTSLDGNFNCDLLVINSDTRSGSVHKAKAITQAIMEKLLPMQPAFIFKKIDSVLRGHMLAEIKVMMKTGQHNQALIIAGNPSLGRTIRDGFYYVNDFPIHLTSFAKDPEFPATWYDVDVMLRAGNKHISVLPVGMSFSLADFAIGNVEKIEDYNTWAIATKRRNNLLLVGTSLFFSAVLESKGFAQQPLQHEKNTAVKVPALYVSGTAFKERVAAIRKLAKSGGPVCYAPPELFRSKKPSLKSLKIWTDKTIELLQKEKAVIAFDNASLPKNSAANLLRKTMAQTVQMICKKITIRELVIEGGATAAAIFNELNFHRFVPVQELLPGVIRMQIKESPDCFVTLKPGSYPWPPGLWNFDTISN